MPPAPPAAGAPEEGREGTPRRCLCRRWEGEPAPAAWAWAWSASRCLLRDSPLPHRRLALVLPPLGSVQPAARPGPPGSVRFPPRRLALILPPARCGPPGGSPWLSRPLGAIHPAALPPRQTHEDRAACQRQSPGSAPRSQPPPPRLARGPAHSLAGAKGTGRGGLPSPSPPPTWALPKAWMPPAATAPPCDVPAGGGAAPGAPVGTGSRGVGWGGGGRGASRSQVVPGVPRGRARRPGGCVHARLTEPPAAGQPLITRGPESPLAAASHTFAADWPGPGPAPGPRPRPAARGRQSGYLNGEGGRRRGARRRRRLESRCARPPSVPRQPAAAQLAGASPATHPAMLNFGASLQQASVSHLGMLALPPRVAEPAVGG